MKSPMMRVCLLAGAVVSGGFAVTLNADPAVDKSRPPNDSKEGAKAEPERVTVAEARERAKLMHKMYAATLDSLHHHYFRREGSVLPARAMEDIFTEMEEQSKIKSRWIAVNTPAMSINHNPETDFEKKGADVIASGKPEYDRVEDGYYKRAGAVPLGIGCVGCHTKVFGTPAKTPRFAGLVIAIPVSDK